MVAERMAIDLESLVDNDALASELERHPEGIVVRQGGKRVGVLSTLGSRDAAPGTFSNVKLSSGRLHEEPAESPRNVVDDDWYELWQWSRRFDLGLVDIGSEIGPLPKFVFTPERLNRVLDVIASIKDLDANEMRRIVEESLRQRSTALDQDEEAADASQP